MAVLIGEPPQPAFEPEEGRLSHPVRALRFEVGQVHGTRHILQPEALPQQLHCLPVRLKFIVGGLLAAIVQPCTVAAPKPPPSQIEKPHPAPAARTKEEGAGAAIVVGQFG